VRHRAAADTDPLFAGGRQEGIPAVPQLPPLVASRSVAQPCVPVSMRPPTRRPRTVFPVPAGPRAKVRSWTLHRRPHNFSVAECVASRCGPADFAPKPALPSPSGRRRGLYSEPPRPIEDQRTTPLDRLAKWGEPTRQPTRLAQSAQHDQ
jgi:hypothetical protein